jgi:UDP-N-acetylglucosamine diphosphorylase/glucosamine-1-phosphate N-acetyltransferase
MHVILFEDEIVKQLYPVALSRPAFGITCGGYNLIDLIGTLGYPLRAIVRSHLHGLLSADQPELISPLPPGESTGQAPARQAPAGGWRTLLVNARLVPAASVVERLKSLIETDRPALVRTGNSVAAALLGPDDEPPGIDTTIYEIASLCEELKLAPVEIDLPLFQYPHDLVRWNLQIIAENIAHRLAGGGYQEITKGVFAAPGARIGQYCTTDSSGGPILLEADAAVFPHSFLSGPVYIGARSKVLEHAAIKHCVSIGHTCKIGGEVEASIIEPFTNKQHHGFLGHSYVGSWVNIGAGTSTSDLKNTYGLVNMECARQKISTGMQFLGCIIGDYSKTAINTSIFTGKLIGVCSMVYGYVTANVPSFANYARSLGQVTEAPPDVMIVTQARMFARRNIQQRPCDAQLIRDMYELTRYEGQLPKQPPAL